MRRTDVLFVGLLAGSAACTTVHSAYLTNLSAPAAEARPIEGESSKTVFLAMNFDNDYAYEARDQLYAQCPEGSVTGVLSTYETTWYVLFVNHKVKARGYCAPARPKTIAAPKPVLTPEAPAEPAPDAPAASPAAPVEVDIPEETSLRADRGPS